MTSKSSADLGVSQIAVAVVRDAGRVLIGQRQPGASLAGLWEFPGGKVECDETPEQAAARECREETGLSVEIIGSFPESIHQYDYGTVRLHFFDCRLQQPDKSPWPPFRWAPIADLPQYGFPPANAALLRLLADLRE